jgi:hypothetical protein
MTTLFDENPGKLTLSINIKSHDHNIELNLLSRKYRVSSENEFFNNLGEIPEISYKINI